MFTPLTYPSLCHITFQACLLSGSRGANVQSQHPRKVSSELCSLCSARHVSTFRCYQRLLKQKIVPDLPHNLLSRKVLTLGRSLLRGPEISYGEWQFSLTKTVFTWKHDLLIANPEPFCPLGR